MTISTLLVAEARKRNLSINRVTEYALQSIIDYVQQENETESSISLLSRGSFPKGSRAGRSAWYDRHVGIVEVPGSNPGPSTEPSLENKLH